LTLAHACWIAIDMAKQNQKNSLGKQIHEWKDVNEYGEKIMYRAIHHASDWRIIWSYKVGRSEEVVWNDVEEITEDMWETLRDIIWRKYQRKRVPFDLLVAIDKKLGRETEL